MHLKTYLLSTNFARKDYGFHNLRLLFSFLEVDTCATRSECFSSQLVKLMKSQLPMVVASKYESKCNKTDTWCSVKGLCTSEEIVVLLSYIKTALSN